MSFISIIARKKFTSIMSDGRVSDEGIFLQEDYQKFTKIGDTLFIAGTGTKIIYETIVRDITVKKNISFSDYLQEIRESFQRQDMDKAKSKTSIAFGGLNNEQNMEFWTFKSTNRQGQPCYPINDNISFAVLHNTNYDERYFREKLIEIIKQTGDDTIEKIINAQKILNNFVAKIDESVNNNTYQMDIRKNN